MILLEYQNIKIFSVKDYVPNWSEKDFVITKVKNTVLWTCQKAFRVKKEIKRKVNKSYVKWKGSDSLFISWID